MESIHTHTGIFIYIQIRKCKMENSMHPLMLIIFDSYHHHRNLTGRKMRACYEWLTHHNKLAPPIYCDSMENYKLHCNYMHETYWFVILDFCPVWIWLLRIETNGFWMTLLFDCMTCVWHPRFKYIILSTNQHNTNSSNATLNRKCERNTILNAHGCACTQFIDRKQLNHVHPIALTHVHWYGRLITSLIPSISHASTFTTRIPLNLSWNQFINYHIIKFKYKYYMVSYYVFGITVNSTTYCIIQLAAHSMHARLLAHLYRCEHKWYQCNSILNGKLCGLLSMNHENDQLKFIWISLAEHIELIAFNLAKMIAILYSFTATPYGMDDN